MTDNAHSGVAFKQLHQALAEKNFVVNDHYSYVTRRLATHLKIVSGLPFFARSVSGWILPLNLNQSSKLNRHALTSDGDTTSLYRTENSNGGVARHFDRSSLQG